MSVDGKKYRILVVDDEPSVRDALTLLLKHLGHNVQTAADGESALALFPAASFDLVTTDYFMRGMKGDELALRLRRLRPGQRIILITAFEEDLKTSGELTKPVDLVLTKPFSIAELRAAIARVMG